MMKKEFKPYSVQVMNVLHPPTCRVLKEDKRNRKAPKRNGNFDKNQVLRVVVHLCAR